ncbi:MAG TPA: hypothetical protein VLE49_04975 [Anaerolineales bacterium]|nr:hypothetical protein [Anaerolineales bacterium]
MKLIPVKQSPADLAVRLLFICSAALVFSGAVLEFHQIAWGTGVWLGQYAFKWALALLLFASFCVLCLVGVWVALWRGGRLEATFKWLASFRDRLGPFRWILAVLFLAAPISFLQYTFWGLVLHGPYLRVLLAAFSALLVSWLITKEMNRVLNWQGLLAALVLISGAYIISVSLKEVTAYPFSLGWSEGNRLWDYSIRFGHHLYNYPSDQPIPVLLDIGRRSIGGIPFLIPGIKIWQVRLWLALIDIIPYLILGWTAFYLDRKHVWYWLLAGVWAFTFVHQGPIHPPLLISAILVALAWKRPLWLAIPLIIAASYFAEISRLTWMFAPGLWAGMLELSGTPFQGHQPDKSAWLRAISTGLAGLFGGLAVPYLGPGLLQWARSLGSSSAAGVNGAVGAGSTISSRVNATLSTQPFIWSRLFPNATYGVGILIGLALAILPLILILVYLLRTGRWKLSLWQKLAIVLPLFAFFVVGLIASVKIGGGADLHNMDMLIIGLMFVAALVWHNGAYQWLDEIHVSPVWVRLVMVAVIVIPGYNSLLLMTPLSIHADIKTVAALADITDDPLPNPLPDTLPSEEDTAKALKRIQREVATAAENGEVLFMDQRQLLTFGYVEDIPLIPEYDKKVLINHALSGNARYFEKFYQDLASQRFSLIITSPVNRRFDRSEGHFAEENNAWVKWVTTPLLCYYESFDRLKRVDVELLVPRQDISTCDQVLPTHSPE